MAEKYIFTEETVASLVALGKILQRIHERLISEGWTFKDGKHIPPPGWKPPKRPRVWKRKQ